MLRSLRISYYLFKFHLIIVGVNEVVTIFVAYSK